MWKTQILIIDWLSDSSCEFLGKTNQLSGEDNAYCRLIVETHMEIHGRDRLNVTFSSNQHLYSHQ